MLLSTNQPRRRGFLLEPVPPFFCVVLFLSLCTAVFSISATQAADRAVKNATVEITIVRKIEGASRPLRIVSQTATVDGKSASVTFEPTDGIFAVEIDLGKTHFERLTFVIKNATTWEGVTFYPRDKAPSGKNRPATIELKDAPGVSIKAHNGDCVIEFGPAAIKTLQRGGKFQFVNAYRV